MKYFINCKTKEEAKKKYRDLAKRMHPDGGGDGKDMIELQRQYEAYEEPTMTEQQFKNEWRQAMFGSENAFRESIYDKYKGQNQDNPYFHMYNQSYTFTQDNTGELQRLRDENTKLRGQLYQYESVIRSNKTTIEQLANQHHIFALEIAALKSHGRNITKQVDDLRKENNKLIENYPHNAWNTFKHLFKLLFYNKEPANDETK